MSTKNEKSGQLIPRHISAERKCRNSYLKTKRDGNNSASYSFYFDQN